MITNFKTYENIKTTEKSNEDFKKLSKYKPNYKPGDLVKFIGPDKPGIDKNEIFTVDSVDLIDTTDINQYNIPDYYYFTRLKNSAFTLYSAKLKKLTDSEIKEYKYNL